MNILIRVLSNRDIDTIVDSFKKVNWPKPRSIFEKYLEEQQQGERIIWVAYNNEIFAGYITLKWQSKYSSFIKDQVPEIMDLNVLPDHRGYGIGSKLL